MLAHLLNVLTSFNKDIGDFVAVVAGISRKAPYARIKRPAPQRRGTGERYEQATEGWRTFSWFYGRDVDEHSRKAAPWAWRRKRGLCSIRQPGDKLPAWDGSDTRPGGTEWRLRAVGDWNQSPDPQFRGWER